MPAQLLTSVASLCTLHRPQFIVALHQAGRHVRCMPHPSLDINTPCSLACAVTPEPPQALLGAGPDHLMQSRHTPTVLRLTHRRLADHMRPRAATGSASRATPVSSDWLPLASATTAAADSIFSSYARARSSLVAARRMLPPSVRWSMTPPASHPRCAPPLRRGKGLGESIWRACS